ncbi:MAG: LysE family transporter [Spirochaetaceae bacterium]|jgi:threonine/homoserine/homoserine lactone efflux protein|nr:LysE family transporter [Spirochaetaceae bacterium]
MSYTPGPINIMSMNNVKNIGLRNSILFNFGNYAGHFIVMLICLAFSKFLYTAIPQIQLPMKILGAAYLAYLIIKTIVPSKKNETKTNGNRNFFVGMLLQLVNIKIILFGITAMSSYLLPHYKSVLILILFAVLMSSIQLTGNICWTLFGSFLNKLFNNHRLVLNIIMAIMLLYCIIKLFI